jgi:hypothetical protein
MMASRAALISSASSGIGNDQRASASKEGVGSSLSTKKLFIFAVCSAMSADSWEILLGADISWRNVHKRRRSRWHISLEAIVRRGYIDIVGGLIRYANPYHVECVIVSLAHCAPYQC